MTYIRVLGCLVYAHNVRHGRDKFASRTRKCVFIGYLFTHKGWRLYDLETREIFVSWDVKFLEHLFPFVVSKALDDPVMDEGGHVAPLELVDDEIAIGEAEGMMFMSPWAPAMHDLVAPKVEGDALCVEPTRESVLEVGSLGRENEVRGDVELGRGMCTKILSTKLRDVITHTMVKKKSLYVVHLLHHCPQVLLILLHILLVVKKILTNIADF